MKVKRFVSVFIAAVFVFGAAQACFAAGGYELQDIIMNKYELYLGQSFTSIKLKVKNIANVSPQTKTVQYFINNNPVSTLPNAPFQGGMGNVYDIDLGVPVSIMSMGNVNSPGEYELKVTVEGVGEISKGFTVLPVYELKKIILIRTDKYGTAELSAPVNYPIMGNYYKVKVKVKNLGPVGSCNKCVTVFLKVPDTYWWNTLYWHQKNFPGGQGNEYVVTTSGSLFTGGVLIKEPGAYKLKVNVHGVGDIVRDLTIVESPKTKYTIKLADIIIHYFKYKYKKIPRSPLPREGEEEGTDYVFQFAIGNRGDEAAKNAVYLIKVDGRTLVRKKIALPAGRQERLEEELTLRPGRHTVILEVKADNDRNLKDNEKRLKVSVKAKRSSGETGSSERDRSRSR